MNDEDEEDDGMEEGISDGDPWTVDPEILAASGTPALIETGSSAAKPVNPATPASKSSDPKKLDLAKVATYLAIGLVASAAAYFALRKRRRGRRRRG